MRLYAEPIKTQCYIKRDTIMPPIPRSKHGKTKATSQEQTIMTEVPPVGMRR